MLAEIESQDSRGRMRVQEPVQRAVPGVEANLFSAVSLWPRNEKRVCVGGRRGTVSGTGNHVHQRNYLLYLSLSSLSLSPTRRNTYVFWTLQPSLNNSGNNDTNTSQENEIDLLGATPENLRTSQIILTRSPPLRGIAPRASAYGNVKNAGSVIPPGAEDNTTM